EVDLAKNKSRADIDYLGKVMPPGGRGGGIPLTDEQKRTIVRWIDLGCPIDLDYDPKNPEKTGRGWIMDDQRPVLALPGRVGGKNAELSRIVVGMHDYGSGHDMASFRVVADFEIDGVKPGENLAPKFKETTQGVWEWELSKPLAELKRGKLTVSVRDNQGSE